MEKRIHEKDQTILQMEDRIEELEQYTRREDIIISGLKPEITYAEKVMGESESASDSGSDAKKRKKILTNKVEQQVI
jgi:hypothetical protein